MSSTSVSTRKIQELEIQLQSERLRREKLESQLDECRNEIARLVITLRTFEGRIPHEHVVSLVHHRRSSMSHANDSYICLFVKGAATS
jgi:chromosome segregation ATPase